MPLFMTPCSCCSRLPSWFTNSSINLCMPRSYFRLPRRSICCCSPDLHYNIMAPLLFIATLILVYLSVQKSSASERLT